MLYGKKLIKLKNIIIINIKGYRKKSINNLKGTKWHISKKKKSFSRSK